MQDLQTPSKSEVLKAFREADDKGKELLQSLFGKIEPKDITENVLTVADAYDALGLHSEEDERTFLDRHVQSKLAYGKLIVITAALNEGWEPNWDDEDEQKFYPWFYMTSSGFRLDDVDYGYDLSFVGSRLCFRSRELAEYAAVQFVDLYKDFMLIKD